MRVNDRAIIGLDFVRFAAALSVLLYHLAYFWWLPAHDDGRTHYWVALGDFHEPFRCGWVGVSVFFVLSGFVISYTAHGRPIGQFVKSRVLRLYPAAWICATLTLVFTKSGAFGDYFRSMILWPPGPWVSGVYWTLGVEIAFYVSVAIALMLKAPLMRLGLVLGLASAFYWLARTIDFATGRRLSPVFGWFETQDGSLLLLTFGCFFSLGIILWSIRFEDSSRWKIGFAFLQYGTAVISLLASGRFYVASQGGVAWQAIEPPILFTLGVAAIVASIHWNEKLWSFGPRMARAAREVGLATYPLYLLHSEIGRAVMLRTTSLPPHLSLFVAAAGMVVLAFVVVKLEPLPRALLKRAIAFVPGPVPAPQCTPPELP